MEKQIFTWIAWDMQDTMSAMFYDCTITEDFSYLKKGEQYDSIAVDYGEGELIPYDAEGEPFETINLKLIVA